MLTCVEYIAAMRHALGKTPASGHSLWDSFNFAGRFLYRERQWAFRTAGPIDLVITAGSGVLELPGDFGQLVTGTLANGIGRLLYTTQTELAKIRAENTGAGADLYLTLDSATANTGSGLKIRGQVTPAPTDDLTVSIVYRRRWRTVREGADEGTVPPILEDWEAALLHKACAVAKARENDDSASSSEAMYQAECASLGQEERSIQPNFGPMTGGASRFMPASTRARATLDRPITFQ